MDDAKMKEKVEDLKTKAKSFMKNFSAFGAAKGARGAGGGGPQVFMGQGHRLGGSAESSARGERCCGGGRRMAAGQPDDLRRLQQEKWERERGLPPAQNCSSSGGGGGAASRTIQAGGPVASAAASVKSPAPDDRLRVEREARSTVKVGTMAPDYSSWVHDGPPPLFDPYSSVIASGTSHRPSVRALSGSAAAAAEPPGWQFQCPICQKRWQSEAQVSAHLDDGCAGAEFAGLSVADERRPSSRESGSSGSGAEELDDAVEAFLSGGPAMATIEVIVKVFRKILSAPSEEKYRKLRLENKRIKETIGSAIGGLRFLESVGFRCVVEGQERFSLMDPPTVEQQERLQAAIAYLDSYQSASVQSSRPDDPPAANPPSTCDRQMRIFYAANDRLAERFELPDSFFKLSASEVRSEAAARRKKLEDEQVLIPKSFREKQAAIARRRYKVTVVRIRLPDGLVVQGYFKPGEPTTALYEFASSVLKDSSETFDLVLPGAARQRVIPRFPDDRGHCLTLDEADLVPKALINFVATSEQGYTCLKSECYDLCEPLTLSTVLEPTRG